MTETDVADGRADLDAWSVDDDGDRSGCGGEHDVSFFARDDGAFGLFLDFDDGVSIPQ